MFTQMDVETPLHPEQILILILKEPSFQRISFPKYLAAIDKNFTQGNLDQVIRLIANFNQTLDDILEGI